MKDIIQAVMLALFFPLLLRLIFGPSVYSAALVAIMLVAGFSYIMYLLENDQFGKSVTATKVVLAVWFWPLIMWGRHYWKNEGGS